MSAAQRERLGPLVWRITTVAVLGSLLAQLDATIVDVSLPGLALMLLSPAIAMILFGAERIEQQMGIVAMVAGVVLFVVFLRVEARKAGRALADRSEAVSQSHVYGGRTVARDKFGRTSRTVHRCKARQYASERTERAGRGNNRVISRYERRKAR